ncbi:MAG: type II toxin-antitoxin system HicB family antitoxin, partial [Gammaproteobacteria bacterium]
MLFHIVVEQAEDGWIVAECPALPGCVSQGKDEQEALENIKEAITAWLWGRGPESHVHAGPPTHAAAGHGGRVAGWGSLAASRARTPPGRS